MLDDLAEPRPTRILVVVGSLDVGGVEMDIVRNMPRIDRQRFNIGVYAFIEPGALGGQLAATGLRLLAPNSCTHQHKAVSESDEWKVSQRQDRMADKWPALFRQLSRVPLLRESMRLIGQTRFLSTVVWPLARHIARDRIDVVHCFLPHAYIVGGLAAATVPGCRIVMSRVSSNFYMQGRPHYRFLETRVLHRRVDAVVCNTASIREELRAEGVPESRIVTIYNGIDGAAFEAARKHRVAARRELGIGPAQPVFTFVANLFPYKGHAELLRSLAASKDQLPLGWRLLCAGRDVGNRIGALQQLARDLGVFGNVQFLGPTNDIPRLLAASDIHVHPSLEDALPNSILEAMVAGLPIVATRVGGIPELLEDGEGGLLVEPGDTVELAAAICALTSNPNRRNEMGQRNKIRAKQHFSIDRSVRDYERLYAGLGGRNDMPKSVPLANGRSPTAARPEA